MDFKNFDLKNAITGHHSKEADVYENPALVEDVVKRIDTIATTDVDNAKTAIIAAVDALNNVNGFSTYLGSVDSGVFVSTLDSVALEVKEISNKISNKADAIKTYSESSLLEKIGSSGAMLLTKVGEGVLSIFENIGDGVVSVIGWLAPKDSGLEQACEDFVKKDWSHDAFNFYYESEFAKKSAIGESGLISGAAKFAGQVISFAAIGAGVNAVAESVGGGSGVASKIFNALAGTTKRMAVTEASLIGMGTGTEAALKSGKDMDSASLSGLFSAAVSGTIAWGIGTLTEKWIAKRSGTKAGELFQNQGDETAGALADKVDDVAKQAADQTDDVARAAFDQTDDIARSSVEQADEILQNAGEGGLTRQQQLAQEYKDNLPEMLEKKISLEQYFELKGETITSCSTRAEAGALYGDATGEMYEIVDRVGADTGIAQRYLNRVDKVIREVSDKPVESIDLGSAEYQVKAILKEAGLDATTQDNLWNLYKYKIKMGTTVDTGGLYKALESYMTEDEATRLSSMVTSADSYSSRLLGNATAAQKEAAYVYTKNGYEEMNSILTGDVKGYYSRFYGSEGVSQEEMLQSVYREAIGNSENAANGYQELAQLVRNNPMQENVTVYRCVKDFSGLTKVKQLTAGTSFTNEGFTSATASSYDFAQILAEKPSGTPIRLDIMIPKGSEAAYIEPLSGIPGYFQNEVLINPNSTITIVQNAFQEKVGNRMVTVVKCLLSN